MRTKVVVKRRLPDLGSEASLAALERLAASASYLDAPVFTLPRKVRISRPFVPADAMMLVLSLLAFAGLYCWANGTIDSFLRNWNVADLLH